MLMLLFFTNAGLNHVNVVPLLAPIMSMLLLFLYYSWHQLYYVVGPYVQCLAHEIIYVTARDTFGCCWFGCYCWCWFFTSGILKFQGLTPYMFPCTLSVNIRRGWTAKPGFCICAILQVFVFVFVIKISQDINIPIIWYICISYVSYETECDIRENFDTNECPNIFVSTKLHEWISEYIHINFCDTNECPN